MYTLGAVGPEDIKPIVLQATFRLTIRGATEAYKKTNMHDPFYQKPRQPVWHPQFPANIQVRQRDTQAINPEKTHPGPKGILRPIERLCVKPSGIATCWRASSKTWIMDSA
jgi:hypothetical protein